MRNLSEIRVLVVENPHTNLPAKPLRNWDNVMISSNKKNRDERYEKYNPDNFRNIREAFNANL